MCECAYCVDTALQYFLVIAAMFLVCTILIVICIVVMAITMAWAFDVMGLPKMFGPEEQRDLDIHLPPPPPQMNASQEHYLQALERSLGENWVPYMSLEGRGLTMKRVGADWKYIGGGVLIAMVSVSIVCLIAYLVAMNISMFIVKFWAVGGILCCGFLVIIYILELYTSWYIQRGLKDDNG